ncbi:SRPBCC family protein [Haloferax sp. DFSO60]|uniref:SRPBCC family protein n=1 Tax=Haloferax sp. DFSO60 TaxID=3388652 RepID=UPI00397C5B82
MAHELSTTIDIDAPPTDVWAVLLDFDHYPDWNPFMRIAGRANEGATLTVHMQPPGGRESVFTPDVVGCEPNRELRWLGHLFTPGIFDGEHRFHLEPLDGGERTRFTHAERFTGLFAGLVLRFIGEQTRAGFIEMNEALKARVEEPNGTEKREATESA